MFLIFVSIPFFMNDTPRFSKPPESIYHFSCESGQVSASIRACPVIQRGQGHCIAVSRSAREIVLPLIADMEPAALSIREANTIWFPQANFPQSCVKMLVNPSGWSALFPCLTKNLLCGNSATLHAGKISFFWCVRVQQGWRLARPTIRKGESLTSAGHIGFASLMLKRRGTSCPQL